MEKDSEKTKDHLAALAFFKDGLSKEEIERALESIKHVFEMDSIPVVKVWADYYGPPVWYIP